MKAMFYYGQLENILLWGDAGVPGLASASLIPAFVPSPLCALGYPVLPAP